MPDPFDSLSPVATTPQQTDPFDSLPQSKLGTAPVESEDQKGLIDKNLAYVQAAKVGAMNFAGSLAKAVRSVVQPVLDIDPVLGKNAKAQQEAYADYHSGEVQKLEANIDKYGSGLRAAEFAGGMAASAPLGGPMAKFGNLGTDLATNISGPALSKVVQYGGNAATNAIMGGAFGGPEGAATSAILGPAGTMLGNYSQAAQTLNTAKKDAYGAIVYNKDLETNPILKYTKNFFGKLFGAADPDRRLQEDSIPPAIRNLTEALAKKHGSKLDNVYGEASAEEVAKDIKNFNTSLWKDDSQNWTNVMDRLKKENPNVQLNNANQAANAALQFGDTGVKYLDKMIKEIADGGTISVDKLHQYQSVIGGELSNLYARPELGKLVPKNIREVREGLLQDLTDSAMASGNKELADSFLNAQAQTKKLHDFVEEAPSDITKIIDGTLSGFRFVNKILKEGSQENIQKALPYLGKGDDTQSNLHAALLSSAVKDATSDQGMGGFDVGKLLGRIQNAGPIGSALNNTATMKALSGIKKVAEVVQQAKGNGTALQNQMAAGVGQAIDNKTSGLANFGRPAVAGTLASMVGGPAIGAAVGAGVWGTAKLMGYMAANSPIKTLLGKIDDTKVGSQVHNYLVNQFKNNAVRAGIILQQMPDGSVRYDVENPKQKNKIENN